MIELRKTTLLFLFLFVSSVNLLAQDTTRCLIVEKLVKGKVDSAYGISIIEVGSKVEVRTTENIHPVAGNLARVTDTTIILSSGETIFISRITEITWEPPATITTKKNNSAIIIGGMTAAIVGVLLLTRGHAGSLVGVYALVGVGLVAIIIVGVKSTHAGSTGTTKMKKQFGYHWKLSPVPVSVASRYHKTKKH